MPPPKPRAPDPLNFGVRVSAVLLPKCTDSCRRQSLRRVLWKAADDCVLKRPILQWCEKKTRWSGIRITDRITTKSKLILPTHRPKHSLTLADYFCTPCLKKTVHLKKLFLSELRQISTNCYRTTRMHSADYAVARCPSVRPSICHTPVLSLNCYTYFQSFFTVG